MCRSDPVTALGDRHRLHQVVANLLANARTHTPPGTEVETSIAAQDGVAVLTVVDTGPGIPEDLQRRVFERFTRADVSRVRTPAGSDGGSTGLGLAIVAAVVEAHQGTVSVHSVPGRTEFTVRLPLADSQPIPFKLPTNRSRRRSNVQSVGSRGLRPWESAGGHVLPARPTPSPGGQSVQPVGSCSRACAPRDLAGGHVLPGRELGAVELGVATAGGQQVGRAGRARRSGPPRPPGSGRRRRTVDSRWAMTSSRTPGERLAQRRLAPRCSEVESRCAVASSRITTRGWASSSRAMVSRCRSPPDSR